MKELKSYIPSDWSTFLREEIHSKEFNEMEKEIVLLYNTKEIFPAKQQLFRAFHLCALNKLKVVILGQDPYHNTGQANGLAFSVPGGISLPPSLRNIYKELDSDTGAAIPFHGDLSNWAEQGVLLINAILSVEAHKAASHSKIGWQKFTDSIISRISDTKEQIVFILWGNFAHSKQNLIDETKHKIIKSAHPSPLSARNGFFGSQPFSQTNAYLELHKQKKINWDLPIYLK